MLKPKTVSVTVRLPEELVARVDGFAEEEQRVRTNAMAVLLRRGLELSSQINAHQKTSDVPARKR